MDNSVSRRQFLGRAGLAGGVLAGGGFSARPYAAAEVPGWPKLPPVKIHVVYLGLGGAWPKPEFDAPAEVARFNAHLEQVQRRLKDVAFVGKRLIANRLPAAAEEAAQVRDADAVLLIHLAFGSGEPLVKFTETGLPVAIFSQPFSGHDWMYLPRWQASGKRIILAPSSDWNEIERLAALLRVPARMGQSRMLLVGRANGTAAARAGEQVRERIGCEVVPITVQQVVDAHGRVDVREAEAEAEAYWIKPAKKIVEPTREEIVKSARMYLALKALMVERNARAVTIECLGGIPIDVLGYPCLAFSKLNDLGLVGACEADIDSTLTMMMLGYATGLPGFISDPLFDTAKNAMIHAHCVAATCMAGPGTARAPFLIRTHRDDNKGASLEVEMAVGQEVTCTKLVNLNEILISTGTITEIPDFDDRGCRTQIVTAVADAREMARTWGSGVLDDANMMTLLHRVVFYGNHANTVEDLASLMGLKVIVEG